MADLMFRLIYGSENCLWSSEADVEAEIEHVLTSSRRNNAAAGITGALLFTGSHFTQVLEGPQHEVERTFERISQDLRHGGVALIDLQHGSRRAFPSWSMTLLDARAWSRAELAMCTNLTGKTGDEPAGQPIVELMQRFLAKRVAQAQEAAGYAARSLP